jgi:uncharacterized protein (DUF362 family)
MKNRIKFFILLGLVAIICIFAFRDPLMRLFFPGEAVPAIAPKYEDRSVVSIVRSDKDSFRDIDEEEIRRMVRQAVELAGGLKGIVSDYSTVVIKPNLVVTNDYTLSSYGGKPLRVEANGVTTDWRVVKAIVELVRELNPHGKVYVMEGSGQTDTLSVMKYYNYTHEYIPGVDAFLAIETDSGKWHDYNSPGLVRVSLPNGLYKKEYYLNRKYYEADTVISVPCLKTHWHAAVTGAIKNVSIGASPANIYGESPDNTVRTSAVDHESTKGDLHMWIRDFYLCRPVDFVVMDGLVGIQNGPVPGLNTGTDDISKDEMNMRLILAGRDAVAVDTVESLVMMWDPESVKYLQYLGEDRAGNNNPARITVEGVPVDEVRKDFAGLIPPGGGTKFMDTGGPAAVIKYCHIFEDTLTLSLAAGSDTVKAEVYLDGRKVEPVVTAGYDKMTFKLGGKGESAQEVRVVTYDRFLNRTEATSPVARILP